MPVSISVGVSDDEDTSQAFMAAAEDAAAGLDGGCDVCVVFAGGAHLQDPHTFLEIVHSRLAPATLIGCGAGGVIGGDQELEDDAGEVSCGRCLPQARKPRRLNSPASSWATRWRWAACLRIRPSWATRSSSWPTRARTRPDHSFAT